MERKKVCWTRGILYDRSRDAPDLPRRQQHEHRQKWQATILFGRPPPAVPPRNYITCVASTRSTTTVFVFLFLRHAI